MLALGSNELELSNAWRADELIAVVRGYRGVPEVEEPRELDAQRREGSCRSLPGGTRLERMAYEVREPKAEIRTSCAVR